MPWTKGAQTLQDSASLSDIKRVLSTAVHAKVSSLDDIPSKLAERDIQLCFHRAVLASADWNDGSPEHCSKVGWSI